jgi:hypothetical protein
VDETVFRLHCLLNCGKYSVLASNELPAIILGECGQKMCKYAVFQSGETLNNVGNIAMHCVAYVSERSHRCVSQEIGQIPHSSKSGSENV